MGRATGVATRETWAAPATVVQAAVDPESGRPLSDGCRPWGGEAYRELFLRSSMPAPVCPDQGDAMMADAYPGPSDEEDVRDLDPWPEDVRGGSHPAPPPEYEEAESWRRARREAERAWREARREYEERMKEWRKEQRRRRRHLEEDEGT
jgi:hypothetical protein